MEQNKMPKCTIFQLVSSIVILISVFLPWFSASGGGHTESVNMLQIFSLGGLAKSAVTFIPYVVIVLAAANIALLYLKGSKILSIILLVVNALLILIFILAQNQLGVNILGIGFYLFLIATVTLLVGICTRKYPKN